MLIDQKYGLMKKYILLISMTFFSVSTPLFAQEESNWSYDLGLSFFKSSLRNQPVELLYNPVFEKWEAINHQPSEYEVIDYQALDPFSFNLSAGVDILFRYKRYLMIKLGYCYTNTLGIGGKGHITYIDHLLQEIEETKEMSYSSHQYTYFIGPIIHVDQSGASIYMGFSMMSPTYVIYHEQAKKTIDGLIFQDYNHTFKGFFGNCRSVIGMQVPVSKRIKLGSEIVFAYFNGLELKSGDLADEGFMFPDLQWNITCRYLIK